MFLLSDLELKNEVKGLQSLLSNCANVSKKIKNLNVLCQCCKVDCSIANGHFSLSQDLYSKNCDGYLVPFCVGLESNLASHNPTMEIARFQYTCQTCGHNNKVDFFKNGRKSVGNGTSKFVGDIAQVGLMGDFDGTLLILIKW